MGWLLLAIASLSLVQIAPVGGIRDDMESHGLLQIVFPRNEPRIF